MSYSIFSDTITFFLIKVLFLNTLLKLQIFEKLFKTINNETTSDIFLLTYIRFLMLTCSDKSEDDMLFLTIKQKTVNFSRNSFLIVIQIQTNDSYWTATVQKDAETWLKTLSRGSILQINIYNPGNGETPWKIKVTAGKLSEIIVVDNWVWLPPYYFFEMFHHCRRWRRDEIGSYR